MIVRLSTPPFTSSSQRMPPARNAAHKPLPDGVWQRSACEIFPGASTAPERDHHITSHIFCQGVHLQRAWDFEGLKISPTLGSGCSHSLRWRRIFSTTCGSSIFPWLNKATPRLGCSSQLSKLTLRAWLKRGKLSCY